jgi:hypothetical protein
MVSAVGTTTRLLAGRFHVRHTQTDANICVALPVPLHASIVSTNCCVWLGSVGVQIELGDYVTINEPRYNEEGQQCEDLIVARITEIFYTISGQRRIGINWMYRITVGACCVLGAPRLHHKVPGAAGDGGFLLHLHAVCTRPVLPCHSCWDQLCSAVRCYVFYVL